ncbi:MAG: endonuclease, partial [Bacteroidaceae bacterium]|nr:endonuclease [Bacteroidaceae bacterium]
MKKYLLLLFALMVPLMSNCKNVKTSNTKVRWGTFNIRLQNGGDDKAGVGWSVRKDRVAKYIK